LVFFLIVIVRDILDKKQVETYKTRFFESYDDIRGIAKKQFPNAPVDAEAAFNYVLDEIDKNNWERLATCKEDKFDACLYKIVKNLLVDYSRKIKGRYRPPKWITQKGGLWIEIHRLLYLKKLSENEIREKIENVLSEILSHDDRGGYEGGEEPYTSDYENIEKFSILQLVSKIVYGDEAHDEDTNYIFQSAKEIIEKFRSILELNTKERLFLKMIYQEGVKIYEAGEIVFDLTERKSHEKLKKLRNYILTKMKQSQLENELKHLILHK